MDRYEKRRDHGALNCLQFSPNDQLLATRTYGETKVYFLRMSLSSNLIPLWLDMGYRFKNHLQRSVQYRYDRVLSYGTGIIFDEPSRNIWNLRNGSSKIMPVSGRTDDFISVLFSSDGLYIARGSSDGSLWMGLTQVHTCGKWLGPTDSASRIELSPEGKFLMSGSDDGTVKCWDMTLLGFGSEPQSFPRIRAFSGRAVRFFLVLHFD